MAIRRRKNRQLSATTTTPVIGQRHLVPTTITGVGYVGRKGKTSSYAGNRGLWADSPFYKTAATVDSRWDTAQPSRLA